MDELSCSIQQSIPVNGNGMDMDYSAVKSTVTAKGKLVGFILFIGLCLVVVAWEEQRRVSGKSD